MLRVAIVGPRRLRQRRLKGRRWLWKSVAIERVVAHLLDINRGLGVNFLVVMGGSERGNRDLCI